MLICSISAVPALAWQEIHFDDLVSLFILDLWRWSLEDKPDQSGQPGQGLKILETIEHHTL